MLTKLLEGRGLPIPASSLVIQEAVEALISPWPCSLFPKCGDFPLAFSYPFQKTH